jgi:hypothetical protein
LRRATCAAADLTSSSAGIGALAVMGDKDPREGNRRSRGSRRWFPVSQTEPQRPAELTALLRSRDRFSAAGETVRRGQRQGMHTSSSAHRLDEAIASGTPGSPLLVPATTRSSSNDSSHARATSRVRCLPTTTAPRCASASACFHCSDATRGDRGGALSLLDEATRARDR